eukprot:symbB.v1.2.011090.t1/scaffold693.1/size172333/2
MERILQSHRADIATGHQRRKALIEDIRKLQEKVTELEPPEAAPLTVAESPESPETGAATADAPLSAVVDEGEMHDTGQEEVETVDWLGLNQRLGVSKDQLAACIPNTSQSQHPAVPTVAGRGQQAPRGFIYPLHSGF